MQQARKQQMMARRGVRDFVMLVMAGVVVTACGGKKATETGETLAPVVIGPENIAVVAETTLVDGPPISGALGAEREARVRAELGGSVLSVYAEPGQAVKAGELLAQIEPQTAREQATFTDALVRSLENQLRVQRRNLERDRRLADAGAVSTRVVEEDSLTVSQAEASLAEANARQVVAKRALDRASIRAPFAGIVSNQTASVGDVVKDGTELFTIVDPSSLRLEALVPAEALERLKVGTAVQFTLSGYGKEMLTGRVSRIYPSVDPATRQVKILVTVPNPRQTLVMGLFAQGRVITTSHRGLTVPKAAVDVRGVRPSVVQLKDGRLTHTEVAVGLEDAAAEQLEITSGLAVGDTIILGSSRGIPVGTPARVQAAAERASASTAR
jgi:RND family efflux transporter MFP subunit